MRGRPEGCSSLRRCSSICTTTSWQGRQQPMRKCMNAGCRGLKSSRNRSLSCPAPSRTLAGRARRLGVVWPCQSSSHSSAQPCTHVVPQWHMCASRHALTAALHTPNRLPHGGSKEGRIQVPPSTKKDLLNSDSLCRARAQPEPARTNLFFYQNWSRRTQLSWILLDRRLASGAPPLR